MLRNIDTRDIESVFSESFLSEESPSAQTVITESTSDFDESGVVDVQESVQLQTYKNPIDFIDECTVMREGVIPEAKQVMNCATVYGTHDSNSLMYLGAFAEYLEAHIESESAIRHVLAEYGLQEAVVLEARLQDEVKTKWERFKNFIKRISDRFTVAMEKILFNNKKYLEKYKDVILNTKWSESTEFEYDGDYVEGANRCKNTPVPIFNYDTNAKWLRQDGYDEALRNFMAGKNFKYNADKDLKEQFKDFFLAKERGKTTGKMSTLQPKLLYDFCYGYDEILNVVKKDIANLEQATNNIITGVNKEMREKGEDPNKPDTTTKTTENPTTNTTSNNAGSPTKQNDNNTQSSGGTPTNTTGGQHESVIDTSRFWVPLQEEIKITNNEPQKVDGDGNAQDNKESVTGNKKVDTTAQDINNITTKWTTMCNALITAKLTAIQVIARDYMSLIKAHVKMHGGEDNNKAQNNNEQQKKPEDGNSEKKQEQPAGNKEEKKQ